LIEKRLYPSAALHGQVAHEIGRQIVSGSIAQGAFLPREAEFAKTFGVSRQAIREALKVLAAKGLVSSRRRAGTHVLPRGSWNLLDPDVLAWHPAAALSPEFFSDLVELRRLIEPAAAQFAAARGDPERIARIGAALERMRCSTRDTEAYLEADADFHRAVFAASGNILIDHLSTILVPLYAVSFRLQAQASGGHESSLVTHAAVYDAIVAGDPIKARRAMESILMLASSEITKVMIEKASGGGPPSG
jgi:DNA-binding FadR family transcriptional regulator